MKTSKSCVPMMKIDKTPFSLSPRVGSKLRMPRIKNIVEKQNANTNRINWIKVEFMKQNAVTGKKTVIL